MSQKDVVAHYQILRPAAVLRAAGPDAFAFLQSQFSNDLRRPDGARPAIYGLWLDRKGKIMADSTVLQLSPEEFLIVSEFCPAADILAHLQAHLIADELELLDETPKFCLLQSLWDSRATGDTEIAFAAGRPAPGIWSSPEGESGILGWCRSKTTWDFLGPLAACERLAKRLQQAGKQHMDEGLRKLRRSLGEPEIPFDIRPGDLPQEAGLERTAVSFTKGCFLGQEVMARIHAQGHVNRALWRVLVLDPHLKIPTDKPLPLFAGDQNAGELRSDEFAMLKRRVIAGRDYLSIEPNGPDAVRINDTGLGNLLGDHTQPRELRSVEFR